MIPDRFAEYGIARGCRNRFRLHLEAFSEQAGVNPFINRTALYITDSSEETPPQNLQNSFTRWELVDHFQVNRRNEPLHEFRIFACYQYQTLPL